MKHDDLGDRMKDYEGLPRVRLMRKVPVVARFDGRAFHSFCRGLEKPFDQRMAAAMWSAAVALCEEIQGAKLAYVQSDEISVVITDMESLQTEPWFGYDLQKMCSVGASVCTGAFIKGMAYHGLSCFPEALRPGPAKAPPAFDARFWNLPMDDVPNYLIWRQRDATRNSISGLAQTLFSHRELHGKNKNQLMDMMMLERGVNWNDLPAWQKRGVAVVRETYEMPVPEEAVGGGSVNVTMALRHRWVADMETPIFTWDSPYIWDRIKPPVEVLAK